MKNADIFLLVSVREAIDAVHRALGAPGDHGYSTPAGAALFELYKQRAALAAALDEAGRKAGSDCSGAVSPYQPTPKGKAERRLTFSLGADDQQSILTVLAGPRRPVRL
ncbi:MAG: hypothetical protein ABS59_02900 [Methylobacterium sp. SCN 67-24]|nr:MAG: hypothetical protein ABS59_02900 [Methylobacterium sp. SCN 67-24]